jgi:hypothetical protein
MMVGFATLRRRVNWPSRGAAAVRSSRGKGKVDEIRENDLLVVRRRHRAFGGRKGKGREYHR